MNWSRYKFRASELATIEPDDERAVEAFVSALRDSDGDGDVVYTPDAPLVIGWELVDEETERVVASYHAFDVESRFRLHDTDVSSDVLPDDDA